MWKGSMICFQVKAWKHFGNKPLEQGMTGWWITPWKKGSGRRSCTPWSYMVMEWLMKVGIVWWLGALAASWHQTSPAQKPTSWWPAFQRAPHAMRPGQRSGTTCIGVWNVWPQVYTPPVTPMANPWKKGTPCLNMQGKGWPPRTTRGQSSMWLEIWNFLPTHCSSLTGHQNGPAGLVTHTETISRNWNLKVTTVWMHPLQEGSQWVITPCSPYQGWPQGMSGMTCCMCSLWMECYHMSWGPCCTTHAGLTSQVATRRLHQQRGWVFFSLRSKKSTQNTRLSAGWPTWPWACSATQSSPMQPIPCFTARVLSANTWWSPS